MAAFAASARMGAVARHLCGTKVPLDGTALHRKGSAAAASAAAASAAAYYECASPPMHVGTLWLNRTRERNHMTPELLADFSRAVGQARRDAGARAVLVAASEPGGAAGGTASFCAGADLRGGLQAGAALPGASDAERSFAMYEPFLGLLDLQVPVVAAVNGHAVGGGFGMAMLADVRIVSKEARVGANFCRLGLAPGMAISYTLPRLVGEQRALEMMLGGALLSGDEAAAAGWALKAVPSAEVLPAARALAERIARNAPMAVRETLRLSRGEKAAECRRRAREEAAAQAASAHTSDAQEGIAALLEKRMPVFRGK